jgi:arylformamidase
MIITIHKNNIAYEVDLMRPLDISIPVRNGEPNPNCYWAENVSFETISSGDFIGSVKQGGSVNYQKLTITPHGNGTHTECYGHISNDDATIHQCLQHFHYIAEVVTVEVTRQEEDQILLLENLKKRIAFKSQALVIRTLPNDATKLNRKYTNTNPPYLEPSIGDYLASEGYHHVLVDLPSVDREQDKGALANHKSFWRYPHKIRKDCTITELIYVPPTIEDGLYLLNLQIISLEMDASPSKPVLYKLKEVS